MPEHLSPGAYVEEVPSSIRPIIGVRMSTAAFVGVVPDTVSIPEENPDYDPTRPIAAGNQKSITWTFPYPKESYEKANTEFEAASAPGISPPRPKGTRPEDIKAFNNLRETAAVAARHNAVSELAQEGKPVLCTSFAQFRTHFGDFSTDENQRKLVHGVYGFFNNEGTRCYVMRFKTIDGLRAPTALTPLGAINDISMVVAPGITDLVVQSNLIDHCESLRDRVAILDAPENPAELIESDIKLVSDTDYGALYFPRIKVFDIATKLTAPPGDDGNGEIYVSPSGHIAGIYARVGQVYGVHKAPANEPIHGALPKGLEHLISKSVQDGLISGGINCIREINGKIIVWGARTMGGDMNGDVKYIHTRRLLIFLEKSIEEGTHWAAFEPNDRSLWAKIVRNVTAFLTNVWRDGALFGKTPQEAFYVRCDDETNAFEERELGKVTIEIGVAMVRPAEFTIFRVRQQAGAQAQ